MTLVALFRVFELKHLLLKQFSMESIVKVNKSKPLPIIRAALRNINVKDIATKTTFQIIWDHINNELKYVTAAQLIYMWSITSIQI